MTDGQQTYVPGIKDPSDIAKELIQDGIDILAVGIGEEIARIDLESYISKPENLFLASSFNQLVNQLVSEVSQALTCEGSYSSLFDFDLGRLFQNHSKLFWMKCNTVARLVINLPQPHSLYTIYGSFVQWYNVSSRRNDRKFLQLVLHKILLAL